MIKSFMLWILKMTLVFLVTSISIGLNMYYTSFLCYLERKPITAFGVKSVPKLLLQYIS